MSSIKDNYLLFTGGTRASASPFDRSASGAFIILPCSKLAGVEATSDTTTTVAFEGGTNKQDAPTIVKFTHGNTTTTSGHRIKIIAKVIAEGCNEGRHAMVTIADLYNDKFHQGLYEIYDDPGFEVTITTDS